MAPEERIFFQFTRWGSNFTPTRRFAATSPIKGEVGKLAACSSSPLDGGRIGGGCPSDFWMNPMRPVFIGHRRLAPPSQPPQGYPKRVVGTGERAGVVLIMKSPVFAGPMDPAITLAMTHLDQKMRDALAARDSAGLLRQLRQETAGIDFSSNDYLGVSQSDEVAARAAERLKTQSQTKLGSTGSRLISGNDQATEALEAQIAAFHKAEAGLIFGSGYAANTGLLSCLLGAGDTLIMDELIHASMIDGARLSKADRIIFKHNDLASLEDALRQAQGAKVICVESVYSMDGDVAPLPAMVALAEKFDASLVVDEAHSTGIFGDQGQGLVVSLGLEDRVFARVHTFGKALGLHGAAVVGSQTLRDYLINFARPFIFATAPTPHTIANIQAVYDLLPDMEARRKALFGRITYFRSKCAESGATWLDSETWIQALIMPGNTRVRALANELRQQGLWTVPIVSPTVPVGMERIRICLHSFNSEADIDRLFQAIADCTPAFEEGAVR